MTQSDEVWFSQDTVPDSRENHRSGQTLVQGYSRNSMSDSINSIHLQDTQILELNQDLTILSQQLATKPLHVFEKFASFLPAKAAMIFEPRSLAFHTEASLPNT